MLEKLAPGKGFEPHFAGNKALKGWVKSQRPNTTNTRRKRGVRARLTVFGTTMCAKVDGWKSNYESVNWMLRHLSRKCGGEGSS